MSALIQNFDTVEEAIEASAGSAGSALKENERYLDSIQGKIDQFNNATQAMWSNALESDTVKGIVELGTWLIKVIDKVGLLNSALVALATISMIKNKMGPIAFLESISKLITGAASKVKGYATGIMNMVAANTAMTQSTELATVSSLKNALATAKVDVSNKNAILSSLGLASADNSQVISRDALTASTISNMVAEGQLTQAQANTIMSLLGISAASNEVNASRMNELLMTTSLTSAQRGQIIMQLGLSDSLKQLSADEVMNALTSAGMAKADTEAIMAKLGLTAANQGLTASFMALWTAMWPILVVMAGVAVIWGVVKGIDALIKTTEELQEELDGFKSELSDIRSELDSVNQELETTNERMDELLAKDKLTFEEQEELDRLRATNDELERRKGLLEDEEEYKEGLVGRQAARVVDSAKNDRVHSKFSWDLNWENDKNENVVLDRISSYSSIRSKRDNAESLKEYEKYQKKLDKESEKIDEYISTLSEALDGVEYGDSEESDAALDYLAELQDTYGIARGSAGAKTNAIKSIMRKEEFSSMSKAIDYYVEALKNGDASASNAIAEIINDNADFVEELEMRGLEAQDAIALYTQLGSDLNFSTLEGKIAELKLATGQLPNALNNISQFIDGDEVDTAAIAEYFKGTSEETRKEIAKLIQQIKNGEISVENALKQFELFGVQSTLKIEITEVQSNFKDVFTDLEDADGLIDTFQELADAIGSTSKAMDALNAAQAEMDYSGRVSIETALKLMESTDDYSKVLTVVDGKLVLNKDAEENLIEARIENMKASALKALEDAKAARETTVLAKSNAEAALSTYNSAMETEISAAVTASAWDKVLAAAAGLLAGIKSLFTDESWTEAYDRAYQEVLSSRGENRVAEVKSKYASAEEQAKKAQLEKDIEDADKAIEEQDKEIKKLQGNYDIVSTVNKDNIGDVFKSDDLKDPEDAAKTKLDEAMERFQKEMDYWENRIAANQSKYEQIQNEIDLLESKGQKANAAYYQEQIGLENKRMHLLQGQKREAKEYLATLEEGSEEWWEVANTLNDIESEIDDVTASIVNLQDAIDEINVYKFDEFNSRLDNLTSKLGTIRDLIAPNGEEDWFDEEGNWTDSGIAVAGTYLQELETYKQGYQNTVDELAKYQEEYEGNEGWYASLGIHSEQEYYDKVESLVDQQYQYAESISDTEQSIVDMYESSIDAVEEYVDTLIDGYNDYIDSVKEALEAERDLYDFKKNVQKQAKDIAELERRIASLSGSTNKADIAERRKLEAQLYESRESLNDTYYDHAKDAQNEALDAEQQAYETAMTTMVEKMRLSLEEATTDMASFLDSVTIAVSMNADTVLEKYRETEVPLNDAITNPWEEAAEKVIKYGGNANNLMDVWKKDGYFAEFKSTAGTNLSSPWDSGTTAANTFKSSVYTVMSNVVSNISTNVKTASGELSKLYQQIQDTEKRAASANVAVGGGSSSSGYGSGSSGTSKSAVTTQKQLDNAILTKYKLTSSQVLALGYGPLSLSEFENLLKTYQIKYSAIYKQVANTRDIERLSKRVMYGEYVSGPLAVRQYAKGTMGTTYDEWAITDESWIGEEITLAAGKNGQLQYLKKGSAVMPADISANLVEWGKIDPNMLNAGVNPNINMISNAINKPEFNITFDALVKAENITEETLPAVKKLVTQELNRFTKELNYALKGKGAR